MLIVDQPELLDENNEHKEEPKDTVTKITEDMVKVSDKAKGFSAEIIVITDVLISGDSLLIRK